ARRRRGRRAVACGPPRPAAACAAGRGGWGGDAVSRPDLVADIGNTRVKWGLCAADAVLETASLPPDTPDAWDERLRLWGLAGPLTWAIASVHPARRERLAAWARARGDTVHVVEEPKRLPLRTLVEHPEWVGIDRLLDAVAANLRRQHGRAAVL